MSAAIVVAGALVVGHATRSVASVGAPAQAAGPAAPPPPAIAAATLVRAPSRVELEPVEVRPAPSPLVGVSGAELDRYARTTPASLGSVCFGRPNRGRLSNAVELRSEPGLRVMTNDHNSFGTAETVRTLRAALAEFRAVYPRAPELNVGDLSRARGGYLRPHRSHQLGVDADLGYFYTDEGKWYARAGAENLDRELTWGFVKALIAQGGVEYIFMDRSVQMLLRDYAIRQGEDPQWVMDLFEGYSRKDTLIRHAYGHVTHFHVRFLDPSAQRVGRALEGRLRRPGRR